MSVSASCRLTVVEFPLFQILLKPLTDLWHIQIYEPLSALALGTHILIFLCFRSLNIKPGI